MSPHLRVISLGAGVQSTTLALMAAHGEIGPMPDCAIFADTGWEPRAVYQHLAWLRSAKVLPFPVHVVSAGNIHADLNAGTNTGGRRYLTIPAHLLLRNGKRTIGRRQCTREYKIAPISRKTRELLGKGPRDHIAAGAVERWLGISVDEIIRATPSRVRFEVNRFPLLEKGMSRRDCLAWLRSHDYPDPPKSACIGCPLHSDDQWRALRSNSPDEWAEAVAADAAIRDRTDRPGQQQFLHPRCVPLDKVDLSTDAERGQLDFFTHDCSGMCGT